MNPDLPQPFDQEEIRKDPKAVVIGLLIGLLLICLGAIGFLYDKVETKENKIHQVYQEMVDYRTKKAEYYEKMILYKLQVQQLQKDSSQVKEKTEPLVQELLK